MRYRFASSPRSGRAAKGRAAFIVMLFTVIAFASVRPGAAFSVENEAEPAEAASHPAHMASNSQAASTASAASAASTPSVAPIPPESATRTEHSLRIDGRRLDYTATAGNLLLRDDNDQPEASIFYVAYTVHANTKHAKERPVTFLFNGGPGAASVFLLISSVGPKRVRTASPAATPPAPYVLADNPDSLLDKSDLVFVDAVGTGFSKPVGRANGKHFWSVDGDLDAFARFIDRYLSVYQRWNSPKFLAGESYGTARAAMLAYRLDQRSISLNGIVLLSSILNANVHAPGYDLASVRFLPSYAAVAWYHDKIKPAKPTDLPAFLDEVRAFAAGPYAAALAKGDALPDSERDAIAAQYAHYTGLDASYVIAARLRVQPSHFRKELLRGEGRTVGRYDGRFEGLDSDATSDTPEFDASEKYITSAVDGAFHQHLAQDLHYVSNERYRVFNDEVLEAWSWKHREWWSESLDTPYAAGDLAQAMRQNPHLRVLAANGYFDLATPFFSTEYDLLHMGLDPSLRANIRITYYASGHMIYLDDNALHGLKADLARFYDTATAAGE